jgi:hypothetical protein
MGMIMDTATEETTGTRTVQEVRACWLLPWACLESVWTLSVSVLRSSHQISGESAAANKKRSDEEEHHEPGEGADWDGRYKYEVAQTLAARMKGAQVKSDLADLHSTEQSARDAGVSPPSLATVSVDAWTAAQFGSTEHLDVALSASLAFDIDGVDKSVSLSSFRFIHSREHLSEGYTLLHYAAKRPHLGLVRMLASRGANLNRAAANDTKERPLHSAIEGGDIAVVDFLVTQGADLHAGNVRVSRKMEAFSLLIYSRESGPYCSACCGDA